jgi:hypothetical protein
MSALRCLILLLIAFLSMLSDNHAAVVTKHGKNSSKKNNLLESSNQNTAGDLKCPGNTTTSGALCLACKSSATADQRAFCMTW